MGIISVWYQNQNYLSRCTSSHINFGPEGKTRASVAHSSFGPKNRGFDHLDKILSSSTQLRGEKSFYCGSIWSRLILIHKEKNFWNRKFFMSENVQFWLKSQRPKNPCSPTFPQFLLISPININKNVTEFQKISVDFFV